jgi:hypothetical protein
MATLSGRPNGYPLESPSDLTRRSEGSDPDGSRSSQVPKDPSLERRKKLGKELCEAAAEGDLDQVRTAIPMLRWSSSCMHGPISLADVANCNTCSVWQVIIPFEQIKLLVDSNASVDAADYDKRSAMHLACSEGHCVFPSPAMLICS